MPRTKKILNLSESTTREILSTAAARNGVRVVEKVRVADVLQIEGSGISDALYSYALRAHFDFIVVNDAHESLFADRGLLRLRGVGASAGVRALSPGRA